MLRHKIIKTPFLKMILISDGTHLIKCDFLYDEENSRKYQEIPQEDDEILKEASDQLAEYFNGQRATFQLPIIPKGTPFQEKVWQVLQTIPYGKTLTYKEIAIKAGSPKAYQAAGGACRANPYTIIIPCHRVLSTTGAYTGYAGDKVFMKENLLNLESKLFESKNRK